MQGALKATNSAVVRFDKDEETDDTHHDDEDPEDE